MLVDVHMSEVAFMFILQETEVKISYNSPRVLFRINLKYHLFAVIVHAYYN